MSISHSYRGDLNSDCVCRPYLIDLGSTNGTFLNGEEISSKRYYELLHKDVLKFGSSSREYVLLNQDAVE